LELQLPITNLLKAGQLGQLQPAALAIEIRDRPTALAATGFGEAALLLGGPLLDPLAGQAVAGSLGEAIHQGKVGSQAAPGHQPEGRQDNQGN
jgi:hypothetical protein